MSEFTLNLWDATEVDLRFNSITINTPAARIYLTLPKEVKLDPWIWTMEERKEESIRFICKHPAIYHRIDGGCVATGCRCPKSRSDEDHEETGVEF
jgi:hypothetical protein